jgi:hypothetical protein
MITPALDKELRKRFGIEYDSASEWFKYHYFSVACPKCSAQPGESCLDGRTKNGRFLVPPDGWHGERGEVFHALIAEWWGEYVRWQADYAAYINAYINLATPLTVALPVGVPDGR